MTKEHFQHIITPFQDKLYRLALRLTNSRVEAKDVVQEVFIKLWQQRQELSKVNNVEAWSMRLTRNLAIDKTRSKHRRTEDISGVFHLASPQASPYQVAESQDTMTRIKQLMQQLPEQQRLCMHLRDIEEMAYQEIAETLEISLSQVKVNLFRARSKMRKLLDRSS
ncbi:MAG: RNA polymerase sigma factor [Saprospiraceae bacterium]